MTIKQFIKDMEINTVACHSKELAFQNSSVAVVKRHWKFCVNKEISEIIDITPIQLHGSNLLSMKVEELKIAINNALWCLFFNALPNSSCAMYNIQMRKKQNKKSQRRLLNPPKSPADRFPTII